MYEMYVPSSFVNMTEKENKAKKAKFTRLLKNLYEILD